MKLKSSLTYSIIATLFSLGANAKIDYNIYDAFIGLGVYSLEPGKVQINDSGKMNSYEFQPTITVGYVWDHNRFFLLTQEFGMTFPSTVRDDNISKFQMYFNSDLGLRLGPTIIKSGIGFYYTSISGPGGTEKLRNGDNITYFPLPENSNASLNFIADSGAELYLGKSFSLKVQLFFFNLISDKAEMNTAYLATLNYHLNPTGGERPNL